MSFLFAKELTHGITPSQVGTLLVYGSAMNDFDDGTGVTSSTIASTVAEDANYLQWDLGTIAQRYIYAKGASNAGNGILVVKVSSDGTTWTDVLRTNSTTATSAIKKLSFRYVRYTCKGNVANDTVTLYELNVFDPTNYNDMSSSTGDTIIEYEVSYRSKVAVIADADDKVNYYVYDLSKVKPTVSEGVLTI
jgi:hypothetical protein